MGVGAGFCWTKCLEPSTKSDLGGRMGRFQILVIFFVWVVSVMGQPAVPVAPIPGNIRPQITNLVPLPSGNQFGAGVTNQFGAGVTNQFGAGVTSQFGAGVADQIVEPLPENEFQRFVAETTGQKLPLFGRQLFTPRTAQFLPEHNLPVTADYVIGTGDELVIRAWGNLDINLQLTVDRDGAINIPQVGVLQVAGMKASQVEGFIKAQVGEAFSELRNERHLWPFEVHKSIGGWSCTKARKLFGQFVEHGHERLV